MKRLCLLLIPAAVGCIVAWQPAYADSDVCGTGLQSIISETTTALNGDYNVYLKLSLPGQQAAVTVFSATDSGCQSLGQAAVNGTTWSKIGTTTFTPGVSVSFETDGSIPGNNDAAAKPQLLFVPISMPCTPNTTCDTTIETANAYLSPIALSTSESGLVLLKITDPTKDTINRVEYYASGQLMYTRKDLQDYDPTYADYYQQKIARVIVYNSGQRAVLEDAAITYTDNLVNFAVRSYVRYSTPIIATSIVIVLVTLLLITRSIARKIEAKNYYNYAHGLGQHVLTAFEKRVQAFTQNHTLRLISNVAVTAVSVIAAIVLINTFVVSPYKVSGTSMVHTLKNGQFLAVNKLPVTLNRQFKPKRGEIIIFHPNYGNIAYSDLRVDNLLVKRIVGLPGERVTSQDGKLKVYNAANPDGYVIEDTEPWGKNVTVESQDAPFDITLSNDQIFVAGDNRPDSIDSRINGALPLSEVVGVVIGY